MENFKVGEIVISIVSRFSWFFKETKRPTLDAPGKGEECEIVHIGNDGYLRLRGYGGVFNPNCFVKKTNPLSMTFKIKYDDMKKKQELILNN